MINNSNAARETRKRIRDVFRARGWRQVGTSPASITGTYSEEWQYRWSTARAYLHWYEDTVEIQLEAGLVNHTIVTQVFEEWPNHRIKWDTDFRTMREQSIRLEPGLPRRRVVFEESKDAKGFYSLFVAYPSES